MAQLVMLQLQILFIVQMVMLQLQILFMVIKEDAEGEVLIQSGEPLKHSRISPIRKIHYSRSETEPNLKFYFFIRLSVLIRIK
jgi:hypothetical protein